jgi:fatty-acyl-CoA synthase
LPCRHNDQLAVEAVDFPAKYTYRELDIAANQIAWWAISYDVGVKTGDKVCLLMENRPEYLAFTTGLSKAGATIALLNTNLTSTLLLHAISTSGARTVVCSISKRDNLLSALQALTASKETEYVELKERGLNVWWFAGKGVEMNSSTLCVKDQPSFVSFKCLQPQVLSDLPDIRPERSYRHGLDARSPLFYIFTSGTTGPSKAAKFSHRRFIGAAVTWSGPSGLEGGDGYYVTLPLYHG